MRQVDTRPTGQPAHTCPALVSCSLVPQGWLENVRESQIDWDL